MINYLKLPSPVERGGRADESGEVKFKHMKKLLFLILISWYAEGQVIMKIDDFLTEVGKNHPVAKQATFRIDQSKAMVMSSKGIFDPTISYENDQKTLDGKSYYNYQNSTLKVFTPIGLSLKGGIEQSNGNFLNPELTKGNLSYVGVEMPLLKGLLTDYKRTALKQAMIFQSQTELERKNTINDLYIEAIETYINWAGSFQNLQLIAQNIENARSRQKLQVIAFDNGDKAAADTLEAFAQVQNLELILQDAVYQYQNSKLGLSRFLWNENGEPFLVQDSVEPDVTLIGLISFSDKTIELIDLAKRNHPELGNYRFKLESLALERNLKRQAMLPQANLKYNLISKSDFAFANASLTNNYKFGVDFKMPLFLREARGDFEKTRFKIKETNAGFDLKAWEIENKIKSYGVELNALNEQTKTAQNLANNYKTLLKNEELKLKQGESSMFLVNSRENKWIESLLKYQSLKIKFLKTTYKQVWAAGE